MVYLKVGDQYADGCFGHLEKFLRIVDYELSEIQSRIDKSKDPDSDGLLDLGEYMIGYGFIAIQRYITSTYPQTPLRGRDRLKRGHQLKNGLHLIEALNAGANYWKHEPEWPFQINYGLPDDEGLTPVSIDRYLNANSKTTYDVIARLRTY